MFFCHSINGLSVIGLIYAKYTSSYYDAYRLFCMSYIKSVSFTEFLIDTIYLNDESFVTILSKDTRLLYFKVSKLGKILCVDKTGFSSPVYYITE